MTSLCVITAVKPDGAEHIAATAESVMATREELGSAGCAVAWIVVVDGPGEIPPLPKGSADKVVRLDRHFGISAARNVALASTDAEWVTALDADDLAVPDGRAQLMSTATSNAVGWIAGNRLLLDGEKTGYWFDTESCWEACRLEESWTWPLAFHPTDLMVRTSVALSAGGWPGVTGAPDMAYALMVSRLASGMRSPSVVTRYRKWDNQFVAQKSNLVVRGQTVAFVESVINSRRALEGRQPISAPTFDEQPIPRG